MTQLRPIATLVGTELAQRLLEASSQQQRDITISAATAATLAARLDDPLLQEALDDLLQDKYSDGMRTVAEAIEEDLDDRAWTLQEKIDASPATAKQRDKMFRQARAAGAVKMAIDLDPGCALNETIYEASHAAAMDPRLPQLISAVLELNTPGNRWAARDFAHLFWPRFIQVDGYVLLKAHYTPDNLAAWKAQRPDHRAAIENVINHVHLEDMFSDTTPEPAVRRVGEHLATAWRRSLGEDIPAPMHVELTGTILTAYAELDTPPEKAP